MALLGLATSNTGALAIIENTMTSISVALWQAVRLSDDMPPGNAPTTPGKAWGPTVPQHTMSTDFACLADPHLPGGDSLQQDHLIAAVEQINSSRPSMVIVLGDMTSDGSCAAYRRVQKALADLTCPLYFVRGNNENRRPDDRRFMEFLGPRHRAFHHGGWFVVLMDTSDPGAVAQETEWLRHVLKKRAPGLPTVVFAHHYLEALAASDRSRLLSVLGQFDVRHHVAAHQHLNREASFGRLRQYVLTSLDADKARSSFPGFYRGALGEQGLDLRFCPVVPRRGRPLVALEERLGACQYPADGDFLPWVAACERLGLRFLQVRLQAQEDHPSEHSISSARRAGLRLIGHLPTVMYSDDGEWLNRAEVKAAAAWVREHDCVLAIVHPPKITAPALNATRTGVRESDLGRRVLDICRQVARSLEGVPMALENNSSKTALMAFGCMPGHLRWLARGITSTGNAIGFCLDVGHAQASAHGVLIGQWFRSLRGHIFALHFHLGDPESRATHRAILTHFSSTNWYGVSAWVARGCTDAPILIELQTIKETAASVEALRAMWKDADQSTVSVSHGNETPLSGL